MTHYTHTIEQTFHLGNTIAKALHSGDIILLHGEMGSGKTTLTKGILSHFGIHPDTVVSPTFSLMQQYSVNSDQEIDTIIHVDTYRLRESQELVDIGLTDYLGESRTVCIIEWPEKAQELLQEKKLIHIYCVSVDETTREYRIDGLPIPEVI